MFIDFKTLFLLNASQPMLKATEALSPKMGGAEGGKVWSDSVAYNLGFKDFLDATAETLRKVDKAELIALVRQSDGVRVKATFRMPSH